LSLVVTPNGAQIKIYNDPANLVEKKILPEQTYSYTYDSQYNLARATNADSDLSFTYDPLSRLTLAQTAGTSINYAYDISSNLTSMTDPAGAITSYIYDNLNRLTDIQQAGQSISHYNYDALSRRTEKSFAVNGSPFVAQYAYDLASNLLSINHERLTMNDLYTYDNVGNRLSLADNNGFHNYVYDNVYRLSSATNPNENYSYDPVGNRNPLSQTYDSGNRLLDDGTYTYTYDHDGNMTKKVKKVGRETTTYTYNSEDQLIGVNGTITYKYDALGRRIAKNIAGAISRYVYDGEDIIQELDQNNQVIATYTHGPGIDEPISLEKSGQKYYYIQDGLGSVSALVDSDGNIVQSYRYNSFGEIINKTGTLEQPFTFTGREFDEETGNYYYRHRYYDPHSGRFLQQDPIWDDNSYSYCWNDPINWFDPLGLTTWPTDYTRITSPFGATRGRTAPHTGMDIRDPKGGNVYSTENGVVIAVYYDANGGNQIRVRNDDGSISGYAHTSSNVKKGESVCEGDIIGYSDASGAAKKGGAHLHYTYRLSINSPKIDPWENQLKRAKLIRR
jgi:RHS repeat-associated protein